MFSRPLAAVAAAALVSSATAQVPSPAPLPSPAPGASSLPNEIVIPEGTEIAALATEKVSSKTAGEGDAVNLKVEEDIKIEGVVVIARGTLVKGSVSEAQRAGHLGHAGKLNVHIDSTHAVDGTHVKLRASKAKAGDEKLGATVALTVLFGPLGLLKKGKEAELREGARMLVYTDEPTKLTIRPPVSAAVPSPPPPQ